MASAPSLEQAEKACEAAVELEWTAVKADHTPGGYRVAYL